MCIRPQEPSPTCYIRERTQKCFSLAIIMHYKRMMDFMMKHDRIFQSYAELIAFLERLVIVCHTLYEPKPNIHRKNHCLTCSPLPCPQFIISCCRQDRATRNRPLAARYHRHSVCIWNQHTLTRKDIVIRTTTIGLLVLLISVSSHTYIALVCSVAVITNPWLSGFVYWMQTRLN